MFYSDVSRLLSITRLEVLLHSFRLSIHSAFWNNACNLENQSLLTQFNLPNRDNIAKRVLAQSLPMISKAVIVLVKTVLIAVWIGSTVYAVSVQGFSAISKVRPTLRLQMSLRQQQ